MFSLKTTSVASALLVFVIVVRVSAKSYQSDSQEFDPCSVQRRCSFEEFLVRAVGSDNTCFLFRNNCLFLNDLCERRASNKPGEVLFWTSFRELLCDCKNLPDLKVVDRSECQAKCIEVCSTDYRPVCAEHDGSEHTFRNKCDLNKLACERDKCKFRWWKYIKNYLSIY